MMIPAKIGARMSILAVGQCSEDKSAGNTGINVRRCAILDVENTILNPSFINDKLMGFNNATAPNFIFFEIY